MFCEVPFSQAAKTMDEIRERGYVPWTLSIIQVR
ncbi:MAG: hypothetical protein H6Q57_2171 [Geobacteraceae bacterium]|nr:hypothetical protein [Geobacteraceae bacterium]